MQFRVMVMLELRRKRRENVINKPIGSTVFKTKDSEDQFSRFGGIFLRPLFARQTETDLIH